MDACNNSSSFKGESTSDLEKTEMETDCGVLEKNEYFLLSEIKYDTSLELSSSSQLSPQKSAIWTKVSGSDVPEVTSSSLHHSGEVSNCTNTSSELFSTISPIIITHSALTKINNNECEKITDSLSDQSCLENGVIELVFPGSCSQRNDLGSSNSSTVKKMDTSVDHQIPHISDSNISNQQLPVHGDNVVLTDLINGCHNDNADDNMNVCNASDVTDLIKDYSHGINESSNNDCTASGVSGVINKPSNDDSDGNIHGSRSRNDPDVIRECSKDTTGIIDYSASSAAVLVNERNSSSNEAINNCTVSNNTVLDNEHNSSTKAINDGAASNSVFINKHNSSGTVAINDYAASSATVLIKEHNNSSIEAIKNCTSSNVTDFINGNSNDNAEYNNHDRIALNEHNSFVIKQEPCDLTYQGTELQHSICSLVVYSDSGDDDDMGDDCTGSPVIVKQEPYDSGYERSAGSTICTNLINGFSNENTDGGIKKSITSNVVNDSSVSGVIIKEEPYDVDYERPELKYRDGAIVVDSDDDTSNTLSSNDVPSILDNADDGDGDYDDYYHTSDEESGGIRKVHKDAVSKYKIRTAGEVFPEELPSIEYLTISPDENVILEHIGTVSGIVGVLVIVKSNCESAALYDDTVLFLNGRQPLGLIFEIFGTVAQPFYSVRFNCNQDIKDRNISVGDKVFFAPKADNLTKYVFLSELKKIQCNDASWENDNEPPPDVVEYSDDEEERRALQRAQSKLRAIKNKGDGPARRKRRRRKPQEEQDKDPSGPRLLEGDLNKNPFGNKNKKFGSSVRSLRPKFGNSHTGNSQHVSANRPLSSPMSSPQRPPSPSSFGPRMQQPPPCASFVEGPGWNTPVRLRGLTPNGSPNFGSFGNNMFNQFRPPPPFNSMPPFLPGSVSHPPQNPPYSQRNNLGRPPFLTRPNLEPINTSLPPPQNANFQVRPPPFYPTFNSSRPPPVVNAVFTQPPPPLRPPVPR